MQPKLDHKERAPKFGAWMTLRLPDGEEIHYTFDGEVPKEIMDAYKQVIGDGNAHVSASSDMGIKDFGTGAGAMVSVSLTCDQSQQGIHQAAQLASQASLYYSKLHRANVEAELLQILEQRRAQGVSYKTS